jgi:predicted GNAT family acetyltransferase
MEIDGIPSYMIKAAARPSINFETITMDHINVKRKLQGKGEWQDITITLFDP